MKTVIEFLKETNPELLKDLGNGTVKPKVFKTMEEYANQSKWISVETEKPEDREYVDCYLSKEINGKNFAYSTYSKKYGFENVPSRIVTHFRRPEKP